MAIAGFKSVLATTQQVAVEQVMLRVLADPRVRAARTKSRALLEASPLSHVPDGKSRLDHALDAWLNYLAFQESSADPDRPAVIWYCNVSTYSWFGHTVPAVGAAIDNPDNIYRSLPIDGAARYEIHGQLRPMHPAQFSFQLLRHDGTIPSGDDSTSLGVLPSRDMQIAEDGSFTLTVDAGPANGRPNHMQSRPGPLLRLLVRDSLSSWLQSANELTVTRVGGPVSRPAPDEATIASRVADQLHDWVAGWLNYVSRYSGVPAENTIVQPWGRAGGWGLVSPGRFRLGDDEAMLLTIDDAGSEYSAIQLTDVWTIATDPQKYVSSYTTKQTRLNADGTHTFVIAPRDPGTINWVETAGMHQGWFAVRWQGLPRTRTNGDDLIRDLKVVKASELASLLPAESRGVTPERREKERAQRFNEWRLRLATGK
jgi:hypothetical protein